VYAEMDSLHVKKISIKDLMDYVYIVRIDKMLVKYFILL
jgi:hypothetical protein